MQMTPSGFCLDGTWQDQEDFTGYDYTNYILPANATVAQCLALCCDDPDCFAYTFANPQPMESVVGGDGFPCVAGQPCCWLKGAGAHPTGT